jgi:hypothetical protein
MKIDLLGGRTIFLSQLNQWRTNEGVLCGYPDSGMNDEKVARTVEKARKLATALGDPVLIEPRRTSVPADIARRAPAGEWLPATTCIAVFGSNELARDDSEPYSSMIVAWFQDDFAMPVDEDVLASIRQIDWEKRATDWCW